MSTNGVLPKEDKTPQTIGGYEHVVFLGTFNADPFKSQIEKWLPKLDLTNAALIVADNHSTDSTTQWMEELLASLDCFAVLEINERNYGGYGNLATNLHRFQDAKWITTLHQDDQYAPQHVQHHRGILTNATSDLGMICSEALSITTEGKRIGYPRAHWLLENNPDSVTVFLAHLRNHAYPFSGATFSKEVLSNFPIPWHSTSFPDTEIVMKMAVDYRVEFADGVTVKYLENPNSESHSLTPVHRDFGAFQALIRVFAHPNYEKLCKQIPECDIAGYLKSLDEGISHRFQNASYSDLMKQAAFEITAQHIGTGLEMANYLAAGYTRVGDVRALEILEALGARLKGHAQPELSKEVRQKSLQRSPRISKYLTSLSGFVPRWLRRILFKAFLKSDLGRSKLASWDFDWKIK
jgi:glycosyltransferase involved in cell wall biosynthesis